MGQPLPCLLQAPAQKTRKTGYQMGNKDSKLFFNKSQIQNKAQNLSRVRPTPQSSLSPIEGLQGEQRKGRAGPARSLFSSSVGCPEEELFPNTKSCSFRNFSASPCLFFFFFPASSHFWARLFSWVSRANFAFYSLRYK